MKGHGHLQGESLAGIQTFERSEKGSLAHTRLLRSLFPAGTRPKDAERRGREEKDALPHARCPKRAGASEMDLLSPNTKPRKPLSDVNEDAADKFIKMMDFASRKEKEGFDGEMEKPEEEMAETRAEKENSTEADQEDGQAPTFAETSPFEDQADSPVMVNEIEDIRTPMAQKVPETPAPYHHRDNGKTDPLEAMLVQEIFDLVEWKRPEKTGLVFGVGFVFLLVQPLSMVSFSTVTAVSYSLLTVLGYNSAKTFMYPSESPREYRVGVERVRSVTERIVPFLNVAIALASKLLSGQDEKKTLKLASLLWLCASIGSYMCTSTFLTIAWVAIFSLPTLLNHDLVTDQTRTLMDTISSEWAAQSKALGLTWKHKLAAGAFVYFLIARLCTYTTFLFAIFVLLNLVKLNLQPLEAEKVRVRARRVQEFAWQLATPVSHFKKRL